MSTDTTGSGQNRENDVRVSAAYRESATGGTPQHLDDLVLRRAAMAVRPPLGRLRSWTRPLAWAATIALSVAIVLEVARTPAPDGVPATPAVEMRHIERPGATKTEATAADRPAVAADEAGVSPPPEASLSRQGAGESLETAPAAETAGRIDARLQAEQELEIKGSAATPPAAARKTAVPATTGLGEDAAGPDACDADARSTAESWLACIERLEKSGQTAAAERERELFAAAFGDSVPQ
jgi:hypothetical protein